MSTKRICALTMVRNDDFFLRKWIQYYGGQLGEAHLYVYLDGADQPIPEHTGDAHITVVPRIDGNIVKADRGRIHFLSERAAELLKSYDLIIGTDVDEFLVVDPAIGRSLADYLSDIDISTTVSGLGIDVGQHIQHEAEIDASRPFLTQRHYGFLSSRYTKSSVIARPVAWGAGFHRVRHHNFHIDPNLFLFHFGCIDMKRIEARFSDQDRVKNGWTRHLLKRARTIKIVTETPSRSWDDCIPSARRMQTICRKPNAWNKPTMLKKVVVRIPERFRNIV